MNVSLKETIMAFVKKNIALVQEIVKLFSKKIRNFNPANFHLSLRMEQIIMTVQIIKIQMANFGVLLKLIQTHLGIFQIRIFGDIVKKTTVLTTRMAKIILPMILSQFLSNFLETKAMAKAKLDFKIKIFNLYLGILSFCC